MSGDSYLIAGSWLEQMDVGHLPNKQWFGCFVVFAENHEMK